MLGRTRLIAKAAAAALGLALVLPVAPASAAPTATLEASLTGAAEVPGPGDADGIGVAQIRINVPKSKVCFTLVAIDITLPAAAAHIHEGAADVAGPVVVTLAPPVEIGTSGVGLSNGCVGDQPKALLRSIRRSPGDFYVNVHTSDFPDGAIRGALSVVA
ncbi:MAG: CHRD domain-containing protein [Actinomycetota bacterium]|jgi:hypothetical protein